MKRYYQITALSFFTLSAYVIFESRFTYLYYTEYGPGPGFLQFCCGCLLAGTSLVWFFRVSFYPVEDKPKGFFPSKESAIKVLSSIIALTVFRSAPYRRHRLRLISCHDPLNVLPGKPDTSEPSLVGVPRSVRCQDYVFEIEQGVVVVDWLLAEHVNPRAEDLRLLERLG